MRMLHIRNAPDASAAISPLHEDSPGAAASGRQRKQAGSLAPIPVSLFCPTRTTFTTSHYLQLPLPQKLPSLALHPAYQLDRGSVRHHQLSRTRNGRQCMDGSRLVKAMPPSRRRSSHALAELLRWKRIRDRSFEDPPDRREFPLAEAPTTFVLRTII